MHISAQTDTAIQLPQAQKLPRGNRQARRASAARPARATAQEASRQLHAAVRAHMQAALAWLRGGRQGEPPVLALKGSAGLGKTTALLHELARPEWRTLRILYQVPSLDLGDELAGKATALGIDARVIRGRSQPQPGQSKDGARMCAKYDIAESLAALGVDITNTLCRSKARERGKADEECPFAATCPYLAQLRNKRPGLLIAAHQYIPLTVEGMKEEGIDLLIIDETFWQSMTRRGHVDIARFTQLRGPGGNGYGPRKDESKQQLMDRRAEAMNAFDGVLDKVRRVLAAPAEVEITLDHFRAEGLTPEECHFAKAYEYSRLGKPEITAGMPAPKQREAIKKAKIDEAYGFARIWHILAEELALPRGQLVGLVRDLAWFNRKAEAIQCVLLTHWSPEAKIADVPLVLIDADLDAEIAARFFPRASRMVEIDASWSNVVIRQVLDRAVSRNMLAGRSQDASERQRNANRRDDLWYAALDMSERHGHPMRFSDDEAADQVARARRPLLVTYKGVEDIWAAEGRLEAPGEPDAPLRAALPFSVAHLGDLRGKDGWRDVSGAIIAGRLEPSPGEPESLARAIFYADPRPLLFIAPDDQGNRRYPMTTRPVTFRDGTEQDVDVAYHPDPRVDAILRQIRESEILQAVARVRPIHRQPGNPCEIVIATNIPLPGLIVDEAIEWSDLRTDNFRRMELDGFLPDLAADCAAAYPALYSNAEAARRARSRAELARTSKGQDAIRDKARLIHLWSVSRITRQSVRVEYKRPDGRGNRAGGGFVRVLPGESEASIIARILLLLPDALQIAVVGFVPDAAKHPEASEEMLAQALGWIEPWLDTDEVGFVRSLEVLDEDEAPSIPPTG